MRDAEQLAKRLHAELNKVIVGQKEVLDQLLAVILARGHVLIEGVPGTVKTLVVKALARICRLEFQPIQCTPDLMPGDILGANVYNVSTGTSSFRRGPIFTDLLLLDEVNRMTPRSQAALLECMEERQVTLAFHSHNREVWLEAVGIIAYFLLQFGYFAAFESCWNGQTPGKRYLNLRVIKDSGRPINVYDSVARNLLRIVDSLPGLYGVGILSVLVSKNSQRLGDFVAETVVVHEQPLAVRPSVSWAGSGSTVPFRLRYVNSYAW